MKESISRESTNGQSYKKVDEVSEHGLVNERHNCHAHQTSHTDEKHADQSGEPFWKRNRKQFVTEILCNGGKYVCKHTM